MKQNADEEKARQRNQRFPAKPEATAHTNTLNAWPGGGQNSRNEKGNPPTGQKKFKELTDAVKEKIRAFQKKSTFPLTDGADKQTAKMLNLCGNCGFYGHQPDKCRLPEGATSRFNNITAENKKGAEKSQGNGSD